MAVFQIGEYGRIDVRSDWAGRATHQGQHAPVFREHRQSGYPKISQIGYDQSAGETRRPAHVSTWPDSNAENLQTLVRLKVGRLSLEITTAPRLTNKLAILCCDLAADGHDMWPSLNFESLK